ncbi:LOW QUALITY PROTEIN: hypothetical protein CVT26_013832 [Gymnopilus dilepis]|uniref:Uncharacterized protein n=1 Tax=Gymnopilus dilepis TaxID=231916 RepID=A0A409VVX2_9AGAR|nr:LOW QUALITY PROTEIN: hypothetical protein CVT26_013832 [Gymnopilus dilepis]
MTVERKKVRVGKKKRGEIPNLYSEKIGTALGILSQKWRYHRRTFQFEVPPPSPWSTQHVYSRAGLGEQTWKGVDLTLGIGYVVLHILKEQLMRQALRSSGFNSADLASTTVDRHSRPRSSIQSQWTSIFASSRPRRSQEEVIWIVVAQHIRTTDSSLANLGTCDWIKCIATEHFSRDAYQLRSLYSFHSYCWAKC